MINYWWVTRPKRKLNSIPEVLSTFAELSLDQEWNGQRSTHLSLEEALEQAGLKRIGERRDQTGGGARTYKAWLMSLGLIFVQESTKQIKLTLAGEAIMAGKPPVKILKHQILRYQFPSSFSLARSVQVSNRFKIRPFRFIFKLLMDSRLNYYLTEQEIAKVVIVEAETELESVYEAVVRKIISYRDFGDDSLESNFHNKYSSGKGSINIAYPYRHLMDTANTIINWIEYTQLAKRNESRHLVVLEEAKSEVNEFLSREIAFIDRPEEHEFFQRKYGVDPDHTKDMRNLRSSRTITNIMIAEQKIRQAFLLESLNRPIGRITSSLIDRISETTGIERSIVDTTLQRYYPRGAIGSFMSEYFELAFRGRDNAIKFEVATAELFEHVFSFRTKHVGPIGLTPDVLVISDDEQFLGIIDNKAYSKYSISNDHKNRMIHNYIPTYLNNEHPLAFFSYIAGGFSSTIDSQIQSIVNISGVNGSAISVSNVIKMVEKNEIEPINHKDMKALLGINRQVVQFDVLNIGTTQTQYDEEFSVTTLDQVAEN